MSRNRARVYVILATLLMLFLAAKVWAVTAEDFKVENADDEAGWFWLRQDDASARWAFTALPEGKRPDEPRACEVYVEALVAAEARDKVGHEKHLALTIQSGGFNHTFPVVLDDAIGEGRGTDRTSEGVLSQTMLRRGTDKVALKRLCRTYVETGRMQVAYRWRASEEPCCRNHPGFEHPVAVRPESIRVLFQERLR